MWRVTSKCQPVVPSPRSALGREDSGAPTTVGYTDEVVAARASTRPAPCLRGEYRAPEVWAASVRGRAVPMMRFWTTSAFWRALIEANIGSDWTRCRTTALAPTSWGVAMDVPDMNP